MSLYRFLSTAVDNLRLKSVVKYQNNIAIMPLICYNMQACPVGGTSDQTVDKHVDNFVYNMCFSCGARTAFSGIYKEGSS